MKFGYIAGLFHAIFLTFSTPSFAKIIQVGATGDVRTLAEASAMAKDGDIIEIASGEWHGDVAAWEGKRLTIRGIGKRPVFFADGKSQEGKAIWVFRSGDFIVENIEFRGTRVPDGNGAGIRLESGKLHVKACSFIDNENGILTSNHQDAALTVENSLFAEAPKQGNLLHLLYAGRIASLKVVGSRFHAGRAGHLIKSRARSTELSYNLIVDGPGGAASYEVDLPNGGAASLIGNVIEQSETSENPVVVAYAAEGSVWEKNQLLLAHNTFLSKGLKPAWFIRVWRDKVPRTLEVLTINNLYSGFGLFNYGLGSGEGNYWVPASMFRAPDILDFRLKDDSWLLNVVSAAIIDGKSFSPLNEFSLPIGTKSISVSNRLTPGAFQ
ncbi:MAG: hypothetical protein Q8S26_01330 [Azonexus sp.]|nr:hypothetical protein [Azonexus sp.]